MPADGASGNRTALTSTELTRRRFVSGGALTVLSAVLSAGAAAAPPAGRPARIGYMSFGPVSRGGLAGSHEGFLQGLRELGHVPGQNVAIEYRHAAGRAENLPQAARELIDLKVDVILAVGAKDVDALLKLTRTVPIVAVYVSDHVRLGYADGLARPGRNVTGLSTLAGELTVKWLETLKEVRPDLAQVGVLWDLGMGPASSMDTAAWRPEDAFQSLGVRRHPMPVSSAEDVEPAFETARKAGVGALMLGPSSGVLRIQLPRIAALAIKHRWPTIADLPVYADGGLLLAYGADIYDLFRRAAGHVVKILTGSRPGDIPVEQPTKFTIVANLKTARALDLTLPPGLLLRADRLVE
jgi:putative tryptophan/tyrosine transport system substrate-binding protein